MSTIAKSAGLAAVFVFSLGNMSGAIALDKERYLELATATIKKADGGFVSNVHKLIKQQEELIKIGVEGAKAYIVTHPEHADLLNEVINNADSMKRMTLDEIEDQWHMGKYMKAKGYDLDKFDHFGELFSLMDAIIHPATSFISLKEYKRTRNVDYLARASAELSEVIVHVKHIKSGKATTQLSSN